MLLTLLFLALLLLLALLGFELLLFPALLFLALLLFLSLAVSALSLLLFAGLAFLGLLLARFALGLGFTLGAFRLILLFILALLLLLLLALLLLKCFLLVLLSLLVHGGLAGVGHLGHQSLLLCLGFPLSILLLFSSIFAVLGFAGRVLFLQELLFDNFGGLALQPLLHVRESLVLALVLDLEQLFDHGFFDLYSAEFVLDDAMGHIWDDKSDENLKADD